MRASVLHVPIAAALAFSSGSVSAETKEKNPGVVSLKDRFSGRVSLGEKAQPRALALAPNVHYQALSLAPGTRATTSLPPNPAFAALRLKGQGGFTIYELHSGKLTTIINGDRRERRAGEFWIVRPGENITLETDDDTVSLQTLQIPGQ